MSYRLSRESFISAEYAALNAEMHGAPRGFGKSGAKHAFEVLTMAREVGALTVLDYGCGAGEFAAALHPAAADLEVMEYDPAVPGKDRLPHRADIVVCTDVLEHVEPERVGAVAWHLRHLARLALLVVVSLVPAHKQLPDGRNAHLTVHPAWWWRGMLANDGWGVLAEYTRPDAEGIPVEWRAWLRRLRR